MQIVSKKLDIFWLQLTVLLKTANQLSVVQTWWRSQFLILETKNLL